MIIVWKILASVVAFLVAIWIASTALTILFGYAYPAFVTVAALALVAPAVFLIWRKNSRVQRQIY